MKRHARRWLIGVAAALALLVVLAALLGPTLAAPFVRDAVADAAAPYFDGDVRVADVDLTWTGPQRVEGITLREKDGRLTGDLRAEATTSLLAVLFGSRDLGVVTVRGDVALVGAAGDDDTPYGIRIPDEPAPSEKEQTTFPEDLKLRVALDGVNVTYTDARIEEAYGAPVGLRHLTGAFDLAVGRPVTIDASAEGEGPVGPLRLTAEVAGLTGPGGVIQTKGATMTADLALAVESALLEALAGVPGAVTSAGGGMLTVHAAVHGPLENLVASVEVQDAGGAVGASLDATIAGGRVRLNSPGVLRAPLTQALVDTATGGGSSVTLDGSTPLTVRIERLDVPLGGLAGGVDYRGATVEATLRTGPISGTLRSDAEAEAAPFSLTPLEATLSAPDLAGPIQISAAGRADYAGSSAGTLSVDLTAEGVVDDEGALYWGVPSTLRGQAALDGVATALLQPFIEPSPIDLVQDVGPTADLTLTASTGAPSPGGSGGAGGAPPIDVDVSVVSDRLTLRAEATIEGDVLTTTGEGLRIVHRDPSPLLSRLAPGMRVVSTADRATTVVGERLRVRRTASGFDWTALHGRFELDTGGFAAALPGGAGELRLDDARASVALREGPVAEVALNTTHAADGSAMTSTARFEVASFVGSRGGWTPERARLAVEASLNGVPVALVSALAPEGSLEGVPLDTLGETLDIRLTARAADGEPAGGGGTAVSVVAENARTLVRADAVLRPGEVVLVRSVELEATLSPDAVETLLARFAPAASGVVSLDRDTRLLAVVEPVEAPLEGFLTPRLESASPVRVSFRTDRPPVLALRLADARPARVALADLSGGGRFSPAEPDHWMGSLNAHALDADQGGAPIGRIDARAESSAAGMALTAGVTDADAARIDALLGRPGLLADSAGSPISVSVAKAPVAGEAPDTLEVSVQAPRLTTNASLRMTDEAVRLAAPVRIDWTMTEAWAASNLATDQPARLTGPTDLTIEVLEAAVALGGAPLRPDVFTLNANVASPHVALTVADADTITYEDVRASVRTEQQEDSPQTVSFTLKTAEGADAAIDATGMARGLFGEDGTVSMESATLNLTATGDVPGTLVDRVAGAGGRVYELLGHRVRMRVRADRFSLTGGSIDASFESPRARGAVRGRVQGGALHMVEPATAQLDVITQRLAAMTISRVLPLIGALEKRSSDEPATVTATDLVVPLDGDLSHLKGHVAIELGRVHYQTEAFFGRLLSLGKVDAEGMLFHDWPALEFTMNNGVVVYDRVSLPLGEFLLDTKGTVNLVEQRADIITYVPLVALVDEVRSIAGKIPGVNRATMIPLRTRGRFGDLKTEAALDQLGKEIIETPGQILEDIFRVFDKKKDEKK